MNSEIGRKYVVLMEGPMDSNNFSIEQRKGGVE
jgi:hypothetical protein